MHHTIRRTLGVICRVFPITRIAAIFVLVLLLYPPWRVSFPRNSGTRRYFAHAPLWNLVQLRAKAHNALGLRGSYNEYFNIEIDTSRLGVEIGAVLAGAFVLSAAPSRLRGRLGHIGEPAQPL